MSSRERDDDRGSRRSRDDDRDERPRSRSRDEDEPRRSNRDRDDDRGSRRSRDDDEDRGSRRSSGSGSGYQYESRGAEQTKKRASMGAQDFDKMLKPHIKMFKPNDGDNRIRILPPTWKDADHFGLDLYVHYGVGADRGSYLDLDKMLGKPDPISEERARAREDGDEDYAKELDSKRRVLIYLIDRDHPKEGVQAWAMPWTVDKDINKISQDKDSGAVLQIDHPEDGYDVEFEKNGTGMKTKYEAVAIARRSSPLDPQDKGWLDFAVDNPLPDQLEYHDYDTIAKAFGAKGKPKARDEDERDSRRSSRDDDRGRDRDDDRRPSRERDRDDDRGRRSTEREDRGSKGRNDDPPRPTWESVHEMTKSELEDLIDDEKLDINPKDAKDVDDLADWVCEEMKLKKSEARGERSEGRGRVRDEAEDEDRLARMRKGRDEDPEERPRGRSRDDEEDRPRSRRRED